MKKGFICWIFLFCLSMIMGNVNAQTYNAEFTKRITILGLGDSITQGGRNFASYLFPLWEKLFGKGYWVDFIGPNESKCRIGSIQCAGYSGKSAEFIESIIDSIYRLYPADVVLLHSGHNHFNKEKPVAGIIRAQESIIQKIHKINPNAKIFVAKVIPSGKLPKYAYLPELNDEIERMMRRINNPNVILVNQFGGFQWSEMTIEDNVHPNKNGAEQMAGTWFDALQKILPHPEVEYSPTKAVYKTLSDGQQLELHIFNPKESGNHSPHSAIIYFFGGGWTYGTPLQFYHECAYYASKGIVAVSAEYRISSVHQSTPFESVEDAHDAIRWLRTNASKLNLDTARIAAAGASAGGHLAAACGIISPKQKDEVSSIPNLLLLYYPVIDNSVSGYGSNLTKKRYQEISPLHNIHAGVPPCLFIMGTEDHLIPSETATRFEKELANNGTSCELHFIEGAGHPIFYYRKSLTNDFYTIQSLTNQFLIKHGFFEKK